MAEARRVSGVKKAMAASEALLDRVEGALHVSPEAAGEAIRFADADVALHWNAHRPRWAAILTQLLDALEGRQAPDLLQAAAGAARVFYRLNRERETRWPTLLPLRRRGLLVLRAYIGVPTHAPAKPRPATSAAEAVAAIETLARTGAIWGTRNVIGSVKGIFAGELTAEQRQRLDALDDDLYAAQGRERERDEYYGGGWLHDLSRGVVKAPPASPPGVGARVLAFRATG